MGETTKIRKRSEIPVADTWATEDMYVSDEAWEQELATLEADKERALTFAGHLTKIPATPPIRPCLVSL